MNFCLFNIRFNLPFFTYIKDNLSQYNNEKRETHLNIYRTNNRENIPVQIINYRKRMEHYKKMFIEDRKKYMKAQWIDIDIHRQ